MVYAKVERIHIDERALTEDGRVDIAKVRPIARMGYYDYTVVTDTFEMRVPGSDDDAAGLAGEPT